MVTMNDIAVRAGVSRATVSYVLNERDNGISIRDETRRRIMEVAEEMGYRRNDLARAVVTGKNFVLGFLTNHPGAEVSSRMLLGAQEEADHSGYLIKQFPLMYGQDYRVPVRRCIEQRVVGLLVTSFDTEALEHIHTEAARFNMPIVLLDNSPGQPWATLVGSDSELGLGLAIDHLQELGHQHLAFVSAQEEMPLARRRAEDFQRLCAARNLPVAPRQIAWTDWEDQKRIETGVQGLLSQSELPTALLCAGDKIAMVAERVARSMGLTLPRDLSIVGYSDFVFASYADPPLTTVVQPFEEMGRVAARHLICAIKAEGGGGELPSRQLMLPTTLQVRESTAPPRQTK